MMQNVLRALRAVVVLAVLTGLAYPLVITGIAQLTMSGKADGSLVAGGRAGRRELVDRAGVGRRRVVPRPALRHRLRRFDVVRVEPRPDLAGARRRDRRSGRRRSSPRGPVQPGLTVADIPVDLLTASASGLDPDISVAAAELQAPADRRGPGPDARPGHGPDRGQHGGARPSASSGRSASTCSSSTSRSSGRHEDGDAHAHGRGRRLATAGQRGRRPRRREARRRGCRLRPRPGSDPAAAEARRTRRSSLAAEHRFALTAELIPAPSWLHERLRTATRSASSHAARGPPLEGRARPRRQCARRMTWTSRFDAARISRVTNEPCISSFHRERCDSPTTICVTDCR